MKLGNAAPLGIALLGLLLGMRHAIDPDHVIAITTILSREHRIGATARIGVVWGLGHTLTVLTVGSAIIVFKIVIPIRLGLAMEFSVAMVLILLGVRTAANVPRRVALRVFGKSIRKADTTDFYRSNTESKAIYRHPHVHSGVREYHTNEGGTHKREPFFRMISHKHRPRDVRYYDPSALVWFMDEPVAPELRYWCLRQFPNHFGRLCILQSSV
jgi:hypothetical protein